MRPATVPAPGSCSPDFISENIIVRVIVGSGCNPSYGVERVSPQRNRRPEGKSNSFEHVSDHDAGRHFYRHSQRFQRRPEVRGGIASVKAADQPELAIEKEWNDIAQEIRAHPYVAVADDEAIVGRKPDHLIQGEDFRVGPL